MNEADRLDILVSKISGYSRAISRELILNGGVLVNGRVITKPGTKIPVDSPMDKVIQLTGPMPRYVGRGGYKLERALEYFKVNLEGRVCLDAGASTGGFTDCMLRHGADMVYAVDCGRDQLDEKLRSDPRVVSMEKTNVRQINVDLFSEPVDFAAADLSFISLKKVILPIMTSLVPGSKVICLIKPQFEAGRDALNKRGIVTNPADHIKCIEDICDFCTGHAIDVLGLTPSPIKGSDGNAEYLILLSAHINGFQTIDYKKMAKEVVNEKNRRSTQ